MKYNTLIFDLDGTLLNTIEDLTDSLNYALEQNNLPTYTVDNVKFFVGSGIKIMIERALKNNMVKLKLTEKEVVDAIKNGAKSFTNPGSKPGIVIPSGLKYTVSKKGDLKEMSFIDKTGKEIPIDVNNPDPNKIYTVATDDFFASGGDNLISNKVAENKIDEKFDFDKDKLTCDYVKKLNAPVEIKDDGRIKVVDA